MEIKQRPKITESDKCYLPKKSKIKFTKRNKKAIKNAENKYITITIKLS